MKATAAGVGRAIVPRRRQRHYSYDESLDEPAKLIADEPVEVEAEAPAEENEPGKSLSQLDGRLPWPGAFHSRLGEND